MTKEQFLSDLAHALAALHPAERQQTLDYYNELIDDKMESGLSEEQVVAGLDNPHTIVAELLAEGGTAPAPMENPPPTIKRPVNLVLLILGAPLWFPLLLAGLSILFALFIVLWSLVISFASVILAFAVSAVAGIVACVPFMMQNTAYAFFLLGSALLLGGLSVLLFVPFQKVCIFCARLTRQTCVFLANKLRGKEGIAA